MDIVERYVLGFDFFPIDFRVQLRLITLNVEKTPIRPGCCTRLGLRGSGRLLAAIGRPAPRRSWTCSLKPPVLPSPSTGGAPKTATWAS